MLYSFYRSVKNVKTKKSMKVTKAVTIYVLVLVLAGTFTSCKKNGSDTTAVADITGTQPDTTVTGNARFNEKHGKVKMTLEIRVPKKANQSVAVHLHEHGSCGDMGKEAHGHWNPTKVNHGKWGGDNFHRGDIGNVKLDKEGKGKIEIETELWTLTGTDSTKNILSKAVIVHGGVDDYKTQPTGNAGSRIGCGVIRKG